MSFHFGVNFNGPQHGHRRHRFHAGHHVHHGHHAHHRRFHLPFFTRTYLRPAPVIVDVPVTPLSAVGRKFVNIGAGAIAFGVLLSVVGACLTPVSLGATGTLCAIGIAFIIGGIAASTYGQIRG